MQQRLGHYVVLEQIGAGGMGVVYRARDERLERDVALKVLSPDSLADDEARRRFRREALALSRLNHPNIATIHDFNTFDGVDVLVMEHIPGTSLDDMVRRGPVPERDVLRLGHQLITALEAAHERGVIHRDLKPGNVRITPDGRLKVLDFGLARALQVEADATTESVTGSTFAGTLPYMAPEQLRGETIDQRTDIYSAGAVLYEMATGVRVHGELSGTRLVGAILEGQGTPARAVNPRVSPELNQILTKALDRDPRLRYQSARELRVDLERLGGLGTAARARMRALATPALNSHRRALLAALTAGVLALTGWMAYREWLREPPVQPQGWILVSDFDNRTGDLELGAVIRDGLTLQLQQSRYLNVLSREQVVDALRRMERAGVPRLDVETAIELCQRENIPLLINGSAYRSGDATWIAASGTNPVTRAVLFTETTQFRSEDELFNRLDSLASQVRRQLGESLNGIAQNSQPLAKVTTGSLDALKLYSRGAEELIGGNADAALPLLQSALDVDPKFAMAHRLIARVYETLGNPAKEREHLARAYELRESLTARERRHVEGSYYRGRGEYEKAVASLTALANLYPSDGEARYDLASAYRDAGDSAKAREELQAALVNDPFATVAYGDLVLLLARESNYERARTVYEEARQRNVRSPKLDWGHGMVLLGEVRVDEARKQFRHIEETSEVYAGTARLYLAAADLLEGKLRAAAERLEAGILLDQKAQNSNAEFKRRSMLARTLLLLNRRAEARAQLDAMLKTEPDRLGPNEWRSLGTLLVQLGDMPRAMAALQQLDRARELSPGAFQESCYQNLAGEIALAQGKVAGAVEAFTRAVTQYPSAAATRALARAYRTQGDAPRAREAWRKVLDARGEIFQEGFAADWVLSYLELARVDRALGDVQEAKSHYERFLAVWRGGDDLPVRRAAAEERRSLD